MKLRKALVLSSFRAQKLFNGKESLVKCFLFFVSLQTNTKERVKSIVILLSYPILHFPLIRTQKFHIFKFRLGITEPKFLQQLMIFCDFYEMIPFYAIQNFLKV